MSIDYYGNVRNDVLSLIPIEQYNKVLEVGGGDFSSLLKFNETHHAELWGLIYIHSPREVSIL